MCFGFCLPDFGFSSGSGSGSAPRRRVPDDPLTKRPHRNGRSAACEEPLADKLRRYFWIALLILLIVFCVLTVLYLLGYLLGFVDGGFFPSFLSFTSSDSSDGHSPSRGAAERGVGPGGGGRPQQGRNAASQVAPASSSGGGGPKDNKILADQGRQAPSQGVGPLGLASAFGAGVAMGAAAGRSIWGGGAKTTDNDNGISDPNAKGTRAQDGVEGPWSGPGPGSAQGPDSGNGAKTGRSAGGFGEEGAGPSVVGETAAAPSTGGWFGFGKGGNEAGADSGTGAGGGKGGDRGAGPEYGKPGEGGLGPGAGYGKPGEGGLGPGAGYGKPGASGTGPGPGYGKPDAGERAAPDTGGWFGFGKGGTGDATSSPDTGAGYGKPEESGAEPGAGYGKPGGGGAGPGPGYGKPVESGAGPGAGYGKPDMGEKAAPDTGGWFGFGKSGSGDGAAASPDTGAGYGKPASGIGEGAGPGNGGDNSRPAKGVEEEAVPAPAAGGWFGFGKGASEEGKASPETGYGKPVSGIREGAGPNAENGKPTSGFGGGGVNPGGNSGYGRDAEDGASPSAGYIIPPSVVAGVATPVAGGWFGFGKSGGDEVGAGPGGTGYGKSGDGGAGPEYGKPGESGAGPGAGYGKPGESGVGLGAGYRKPGEGGLGPGAEYGKPGEGGPSPGPGYEKPDAGERAAPDTGGWFGFGKGGTGDAASGPDTGAGYGKPGEAGAVPNPGPGGRHVSFVQRTLDIHLSVPSRPVLPETAGKKNFALCTGGAFEYRTINFPPFRGYESQHGSYQILQDGLDSNYYWHFNPPGDVIIRLTEPIYIDGMTLIHITNITHPGRDLSTTPKNFEFYGLNEKRGVDSMNPKPFLLGKFQFTKRQEGIQFFPLKSISSEKFSHVELRFLDCYENPEFVDVYRIEIYGKP